MMLDITLLNNQFSLSLIDNLYNNIFANACGGKNTTNMFLFFFMLIVIDKILSDNLSWLY